MTDQEYNNIKARKEQINTEAQKRAERCREDLRQIYVTVFQEGAEWADQHRASDPRDLIFTKPVRIERDADGKVSDTIRKMLANLPTGMGIIARRRNDDMIHFLDPEANGENGYAILDDIPDFEEFKVIYLA